MGSRLTPATNSALLMDTVRRADAIEASHHDGVLEIRIPVREAARPRKITAGAASATPELAAG
jgi:hypothetical protein